MATARLLPPPQVSPARLSASPSSSLPSPMAPYALCLAYRLLHGYCGVDRTKSCTRNAVTLVIPHSMLLGCNRDTF